MPTPVSAAIGTTHQSLEAAGAFDAFVDVDSRLYVDPHLLADTRLPELKGSYARFQKHFADVVSILRASKQRGDFFFKKAAEQLVFREIGNTGLGYAKDDTAGSAIGPKLALKLADLAAQIIEAGITDPVIFELVGLLQDGIGADRISDMTVDIILPDLLRFTERVARDLGVSVRQQSIRGEAYHLPINTLHKGTVILIPRTILRDLPVANSWEDIDTVAAHNADLRQRINPIIGDSWRSATRRISKSELRSALLRNPELLKDLVQQYKAKPAAGYDFAKDRAGQHIWYFLTRDLLEQAPLDLSPFKPVTESNVVEVVRAICTRFKELVENNRLYKVLYNDDGSHRPEKIAQLTFFAMADAYCKANDLELTPEANAGMGPVDFKMARGYRSRVNVEAKLSSNKDAPHGYEKQLPIYDAAEKSVHSFFLLIRVDDSVARINRVAKAQSDAHAAGRRAPELVIVDGRDRPSASKA
jgi:hypothetical protein